MTDTSMNRVLFHTILASICLFASTASANAGVFEKTIEQLQTNQNATPAKLDARIEYALEQEKCTIKGRETTGIGSITLGSGDGGEITAETPDRMRGSRVFATCSNGVLLSIASVYDGTFAVGEARPFMSFSKNIKGEWGQTKDGYFVSPLYKSVKADENGYIAQYSLALRDVANHDKIKSGIRQAVGNAKEQNRDLTVRTYIVTVYDSPNKQVAMENLRQMHKQFAEHLDITN